MKNLNCDLETFSSVNLSKSGVYKYAASPDFEILLFGYSVDGGPVRVVDFTAGEQLPAEVLSALTDPEVTKWAFNAQFERVCLSRWLGLSVGKYLDPASWRCTMVWAATLGLPLSLEGVGAVLGLEKQKLKEGKDLIRYFCTPAKDRGIGVDMGLVRQAIGMDARTNEKLTAQMRRLTALTNPNSVQQMKQWLADHGLEMDSLGKKEVAALLKTAPAPLSEVLLLRQQLAKSSVKKYTAMETAVCPDSRARGMFQFYGANRTGRWAGRIIQLQNLPQNHLPDLAEARSVVRSGDLAAVEMLYEDVPDTLSQLIRTAFVPQYGRKFIVSDFSAIEARVIAWFAGEQWRQEVFAQGGDIYCASASQMFHVPVEKHGRNAHLRQKGKIAELALGYGGSVGALKSMGALEMGVPEDELKPLVDAWRTSNPRIVQFWWDVDREVKRCVKERCATETHGLRFTYQSGFLFITLPSGRRLAYVKPKIGENRFGGESVTYEGVGGTKKWERLETFGGKLVENIVQGTARDILMYAMQTLRCCSIVAHIHDELIIECDRGVSLAAVCEQMGRTPPWAKGLLLRADGYECDFYKKD